VVAVATFFAAAHLHRTLGDSEEAVGVGAGAVCVSGGVVDGGGPDIHENVVPVARRRVDGLENIAEAAGVLVLEHAGAALPVDDTKLNIVCGPSGDAVEDNGSVEVAVDDPLANGRRT